MSDDAYGTCQRCGEHYDFDSVRWQLSCDSRPIERHRCNRCGDASEGFEAAWSAAWRVHRENTDQECHERGHWMHPFEDRCFRCGRLGVRQDTKRDAAE